MRTWMVALGLVGLMALGACSDETESDESQRNEEGEIEEGGEVGVFRLQAGDCFDQPDSGDVTSVEAVPCDEPHDNEVYDKFDLEGDDFPGAAEVQQQGSEGCLGDRFEEYVGLSYQQSIYGAGAITPSEQTWEERDDREVICVAFSLDGSPLEESVEGANE